MLAKQILEKINATSQKLELRKTTVATFIDLIAKSNHMSSKVLLRKLSMPQTHMYRLIHEFTDILDKNTRYITIQKNLVIEAQKASRQILDTEHVADLTFGKKIIKKYRHLRPTPNRDLDQFHATVSTTLKRVRFLLKNGDLNDRRIAFLGDDDLVSLVVASTTKPKNTTVFEIDNRLHQYLAKISQENHLNIQLVKQDLFKPIHKSFLDSYDIVFTDPPYTPNGINIFLNQAIKILKKNLLSRIYLCYGNSDRAREREVEIQKLILEHNLLIKKKQSNFNKYHGAESIGSQSSLYVLDWTPRTKTVIFKKERIYSNE